MKTQRVQVLLLVSLASALGALILTFAAGSHLQIGFHDGFSFDVKAAMGESRVADVLGAVALVAGLLGLGLYLSKGGAAGEQAVPGQAGSSGGAGFTELALLLRRLTKSKRDVWLGGVCGGLGEHTPLPPWVWRLTFLLLLFCYGTGLLLYVLLWICLPEPRDGQEKPGAPSATSATARP